jgi:ribonuclease HII
MHIVGVDEVGRGCWAGPLLAAAVILRTPINGLKDSKVLTKKQREALEIEIYASKADIGIGWVWPAEIDAFGLTAAVRTAMTRAIKQLTHDYDEIIVDGSYNFLAMYPKSRTLIKADAMIPAVSAASIVAKVARDRWMHEYAHVIFPDYGFDRHVGYGTSQHIAALKQHGVTNLHRLNYKPIQQLLIEKGRNRIEITLPPG